MQKIQDSLDHLNNILFNAWLIRFFIGTVVLILGYRTYDRNLMTFSLEFFVFWIIITAISTLVFFITKKLIDNVSEEKNSLLAIKSSV